MEEYIKQEIKKRITSQSKSISSLEKEAGLKMNGIRNILTGRSKKPSIQTLKAIADVLGCSVDALVRSPSNLATENKVNYIENVALFINCVNTVALIIEAEKHQVTIDEVLGIIKESYYFGLTKKPQTVDLEFINWSIKQKLKL